MKILLLRRWLFLLPLLAPFFVFAQQIQVAGRILSEDDQNPLAGVSVKVRGTTVGTQTAADGRFSILASPRDILVFSYIGYLPKEVLASRGSAVITLATTNKSLQDVIVTGYASQKRSSLTGALSVVDGKQIANLPVPDVGNLLQGRAAGVQTTASNGAPGSNAFFRIRGVGSLAAGNDPLFIIDNVPTDSRSYNALNADDIESLTILKDASSAAIYGSRGANGVVVITTKKGKLGEPRISYSFQYGKQYRIPDNFKLMTLDQKLQFEYDLNYANYYIKPFLKQNKYNDIQSAPFAQIQQQWAILKNQQTDWFKILFRPATYEKHEISLSGADDKFSYFFSLDKLRQDGILIGSSLNRTDGRLNVEYKAKKWFTIGGSTNVGYYAIGALRDRFNAQNPNYAAFTTNPYETEYNKDGTYNNTSSGFPVAEAIKNNPESNNVLSGIASYYGIIKPVKGLELKSLIGLNYTNYTREVFIKPGSVLDGYVGDPTAPGSKTDNGASFFNYDFQNTASYKYSIDSTHNFEVLGGVEFTKARFKSYGLSSKGYPSGNVSTQDNGATPTAATSARQDFSLYGIFGKFDYNYRERYYTDISFRRDGSSRFGANTRFGDFYSVGIAWDLQKESFLVNSRFVNQLKVRASIGTSGNYNIGNYNSLPLYGYRSYNGGSAAIPTQVGNPNLTWEKQQATTIGLDFAFLDSKLQGSLDYYNQKRNALLQQVPISSTTGFTTYLENLGALTNKGYELQLSYTILKTNDWRISLDGNVSFNKNIVTKLTGNPTDNIPQPDGYTTLTVGQPYLTYYLVRNGGVDPTTGVPLYLDKTGKSTTTYSANDAVVLKGKSPNPTYFGGITPSISYKGVGLSGLIYFSGGNYIDNRVYSRAISDGANISSELAADALNYWKKPGDKAVNPVPVANNSAVHLTDRFLQSGDFIRLRDVILSYDVPKNLLKTIKIQTLRIFASGHNLYTYRNHFKGDPEVGVGSTESDPVSQATGRPYLNGVYSLYSYPNYRSWTVGLNITL